MAHILNLPLEIQLEIYRSLTNIDDALHLARTCKLLNSVFEAPFSRLDIVRCIIQNAEHHDFDEWLHDSEVRYAGLASEYEDGRIPDLHSRPLSDETFACDQEDQRPSAEVVWSTVCRWHAMKTFFNLYLDSILRPYYLRSLLPYKQDLCVSERFTMALANEGPLPSPSCRDIEILEAGVKHRAYERFYRALCSHWAMINDIWLARNCRYRTSTIRNSIFEMSLFDWIDHHSRETLNDKIEAIEVVDFVWWFLGRKIFCNPDSLTEWVREEDTEFEFFDPEDSAADNWLWFVRYVLQYLRPPQILELLMDMWNPQSRVLDKRKYIHGLGILDQEAYLGFPEIEDTPCVPDTAIFSYQFLERKGIDDIVGGNYWGKYRCSRWVDELRGQVFFAPESEKQLIQRIKRCSCELSKSSEQTNGELNEDPDTDDLD